MFDSATPSLLEPQSQGGDNAGKGFDFQYHFLLSQIPFWLARDGFHSLIHEAIGDIEVKMYSPGSGEKIELFEIKSYRLKTTQFWREIERFYDICKGSPYTYDRFQLVAPEVSEEIGRLNRGLKRLRSPDGFYSQDSGVSRNSFACFKEIVEKMDKPAKYAKFLNDYVFIEIGGLAQSQGEALFGHSFRQYLPEYQDLPQDVVSEIRRKLWALVSPRNKPISRKTIEETICAAVPKDRAIGTVPVRVHTQFYKSESKQRGLVIDWTEFAGLNARQYPDSDKWTVGVVNKLKEVREFILENRCTRQLQHTGNRRLSNTLAIGAVFCATSGFNISMEGRNGVWCNTNEHQGSDDAVSLIVEDPKSQNYDLYVSLGIPCNIRPSIEKFARRQGSTHIPVLNIVFPRPVENAREANAIVTQVKAAIRSAVTRTNASQVHLFCATPSFIALLMGHRLNATSKIQCYEYVGSDIYVPSCLLFN